MILAKLLAGAGEMGMLMCDDCSGPVKHARGCGVPPVFTYNGEEITWSLEWFEAWCAEQKDPDDPSAPGLIADGEAAAWAWGSDLTDTHQIPLADLGYAQALTGTLWRCCPRYYDEFVKGEVLAAAADVISAARWVERGATIEEALDGKPTAAGKDVLGMTLDAIERIRAEKRAREDMARKREAESRSARRQ